MNILDDFKAYAKVGKMYYEKSKQYDEFHKRNPEEEVSKEEWIISTLITDLLVARGEIDSSYSERYNY